MPNNLNSQKNNNQVKVHINKKSPNRSIRIQNELPDLGETPSTDIIKLQINTLMGKNETKSTLKLKDNSYKLPINNDDQNSTDSTRANTISTVNGRQRTIKANIHSSNDKHFTDSTPINTINEAYGIVKSKSKVKTEDKKINDPEQKSIRIPEIISKLQNLNNMDEVKKYYGKRNISPTTNIVKQGVRLKQTVKNINDLHAIAIQSNSRSRNRNPFNECGLVIHTKPDEKKASLLSPQQCPSNRVDEYNSQSNNLNVDHYKTYIKQNSENPCNSSYSSKVNEISRKNVEEDIIYKPLKASALQQFISNQNREEEKEDEEDKDSDCKTVIENNCENDYSWIYNSLYDIPS
jgi:hypothetical protein